MINFITLRECSISFQVFEYISDIFILNIDTKSDFYTRYCIGLF